MGKWSHIWLAAICSTAGGLLAFTAIYLLLAWP
jgi:hypothetical protein